MAACYFHFQVFVHRRGITNTISLTWIRYRWLTNKFLSRFACGPVFLTNLIHKFSKLGAININMWNFLTNSIKIVWFWQTSLANVLQYSCSKTCRAFSCYSSVTNEACQYFRNYNFKWPSYSTSYCDSIHDENYFPHSSNAYLYLPTSVSLAPP